MNKDKEEDSIDILVYDVEKAFDKLFLDDCLNDLVDTITTDKADDKLTLLHTSNEVTKVSINTPFGNTERIVIDDLVQQGGSWGVILFSNSIDSLKSKSKSDSSTLNKSYVPYIYKNKVKVPLLANVDNQNSISKCGFNSLQNNMYVTTQIETKRLNFDRGNETKKGKCVKLHIGKDASKCIPLYVRNKPMEQVNEICYLGDLASGSGSKIGNIKNRVSKSRNILNNIFNILEQMNFGP